MGLSEYENRNKAFRRIWCILTFTSMNVICYYCNKNTARRILKTGLARRQEDDGAGAHLKTDTKKRDKRDPVSTVRVQRAEPGGRG